MRPGTGALPARLLFQRAGMSAAVPGRPRPINIRPPDLLYAKRCNIGRRIDAPEDGRAPDRDCLSSALAGARRFWSPHVSALQCFVSRRHPRPLVGTVVLETKTHTQAQDRLTGCNRGNRAQPVEIVVRPSCHQPCGAIVGKGDGVDEARVGIDSRTASKQKSRKSH